MLQKDEGGGEILVVAAAAAAVNAVAVKCVPPEGKKRGEEDAANTNQTIR